MAWNKSAQIAYQEEIEADLSRPRPQSPAIRLEPFCVVRMGQACQFTVGPTRRCWYCLLTREQIAAGLSLGDVLRAVAS